MAIERVDDFSPELTEAMKLLIPQLSRSSAPMEEGAIRDFIAQSDRRNAHAGYFHESHRFARLGRRCGR